MSLVTAVFRIIYLPNQPYVMIIKSVPHHNFSLSFSHPLGSSGSWFYVQYDHRVCYCCCIIMPNGLSGQTSCGARKVCNLSSNNKAHKYAARGSRLWFRSPFTTTTPKTPPRQQTRRFLIQIDMSARFQSAYKS